MREIVDPELCDSGMGTLEELPVGGWKGRPIIEYCTRTPYKYGVRSTEYLLDSFMVLFTIPPLKNA